MLQLNTSLVRVLFPKPLPIGAQRDSSVQSKKNMAYRLCPSDRGDAAMVCERVPGGILYAEQASALVLKRLLDAVEQETGVRPDRAVISVPAYFKEAQQEATINAGALGLCALRESSRAIPLDQAPDSPSACLNTPRPLFLSPLLGQTTPQITIGARSPDIKLFLLHHGAVLMCVAMRYRGIALCVEA